jgi:carbonic anhydrase
MTCDRSTAPINIPISKSVYPCDLKCAYNFAYGNSSCNIKNEQNFVSLSYDKKSDAKAIRYNTKNLHVQEVRLYSPSLHKYRGQHADAELLIIHGGDGTNLIVSVPIDSGSTISKGGTLLNEIIAQGLPRITNLGESASLGIDNYNLDYIVPSRPFFSYTGTLLYAPCNGKYNYIVFDKPNALHISAESLKQLRNVISPMTAPIRDTEPFYNKLGPNLGGSQDSDIYIECNPTGSDGEVLLYNNDSEDNGDYAAQFDEFLQSPIFKILTAIGIILLGIGVVNLVVKKYASKKGGSGPSLSAGPGPGISSSTSTGPSLSTSP